MMPVVGTEKAGHSVKAFPRTGGGGGDFSLKSKIVHDIANQLKVTVNMGYCDTNMDLKNVILTKCNIVRRFSL